VELKLVLNSKIVNVIKNVKLFHQYRAMEENKSHPWKQSTEPLEAKQGGGVVLGGKHI
jgi:hypothetical protein